MSFLNPKMLVDARIQLHYAIQFMAGTVAALAEPKPDYSHTTLRWDANQQIFSTSSPIKGTSVFKVGLEPVNLTSVILNEQGQTLAALNLDQKTYDDGFQWLRHELNGLGVEAEKIVRLSYPPEDFPDSEIARGAAFDATQSEQRQAIVTYYDRTLPYLQTVVRENSGASPVRIWPHHFDMATLISLPTPESEEARSLGVGFSAGDAGISEPYWYITPWPYPPSDRLTALPQGTWNTEGWVGAILTASELGDISDPKIQQSLQEFIQVAISASKQALES